MLASCDQPALSHSAMLRSMLQQRAVNCSKSSKTKKGNHWPEGTSGWTRPALRQPWLTSCSQPMASGSTPATPTAALAASATIGGHRVASARDLCTFLLACSCAARPPRSRNVLSLASLLVAYSKRVCKLCRDRVQRYRDAHRQCSILKVLFAPRITPRSSLRSSFPSLYRYRNVH